jgi:hypothetical protein
MAYTGEDFVRAWKDAGRLMDAAHPSWRDRPWGSVAASRSRAAGLLAASAFAPEAVARLARIFAAPRGAELAGAK